MTDDEALDSLIAKVLEAEETGRTVDLETLCRLRPELRAQVEAFLSDHRRLGGLLPQRPLARGTDGEPDTDLGPGLRLPCAFGGYELLEVVGQGGMGVVYRARQSRPKRVVALKMLREDALPGAEDVRRFLDEARVVAALDHPHVVGIHEVGTHAGRPFYSMKWCAGGSLATRLRQFCDAPREAAELVRVVAEAMHYVHQRGVLHRDLKPSNVLLDADGRPHVADFGLAKDLADGRPERTATGQLVGSPCYMAPEQVKDRHTLMTTATDVYGLGAVLYALLTGEPPVQGRGLLDTLERVRHVPPAPPRAQNPRVDRELETVCLKCLAKEPAQRYPSALALAEDLRRWQDGYPVLARPVSRRERAWRWCRRNPALSALAALLAVCFLGLSAAGVLLVRQNRELADQRDFARDETRRATASAADVRSRLYAAEMNQTQAAWQMADIGHVEALLKRQIPTRPDEDQRGFEWYYLRHLGAGRNRPVRELAAHVGNAFCAAFSPDGTLLATTGFDQAVRVWDAASFKLVHAFDPFDNDANCVVFSPDGRHLLATGEDGTLWVCDAATGLNRRLFARVVKDENGLTVAVPQACFSPDGTLVAASSWDGRALLFEFPAGRLLHSFPAALQVEAVAFSADGTVLAVGDRDGHVRFWNVASKELVLELREPGVVKAATFSRSGQLLATANYDGHVRLYDLEARQYRHTLKIGQSARGVAFSPDGQTVAASTSSGGLRLWETDTGRLRTSYNGHGDQTWSATFTPDGRTIATAGGDGRIKWWDAEERRASGLLGERSVHARSVAVSPDGHRVAVGWSDGLVSLLRDSSDELTDFVNVGQPVGALAFDYDSRHLAVKRIDGELALFDLESGRLSWQVAAGGGWDTTLVATPDGKHLLTAGQQESARLWSLADGRRVREFTIDGNPTRHATVSSDGKRVLASGDKGVLVLLDLRTGTRLRRFPVEAAEVTSLAFAPRGDGFAVGRADHRVELWTATGRPVLLHGLEGAPISLVFAPDGRSLAVGSQRGQVSLWHTRSGQRMFDLLQAWAAPYFLAFSTDGQRLYAAGHHHRGDVLVWHAPRD